MTRLPVGKEVQPWPSNTVRYIRNSWRGPLHMRVEGVDFHLRYVAFHEHKGEGRYPLHQHPYSELLLPFEGEGVFERPDGEEFPLRPGDALVMPPRAPHSSRWSVGKGMWSLFVVDFDLAIDASQLPLEAGEQLDPAFTPFYEWFAVRNRPMFRLRPAEWREVRAILQAARPRLAQSVYGIGSQMLAAMLQLISLLSRSLREQGLASGRNILAPSDSQEAALLRARTQLESRVIYDPGNIRRLAKAAGYSEEHFIRAFRAAFAITPKQYAQTMLMRRACGLLQGTDLPVREIAARLGYEDPAIFARSFRRSIGASPAAFRAARTGADNRQS